MAGPEAETGPEARDWDGDTAGLLADGGLQIAYPGWLLDVRDGDRDWIRVSEPGAGIFDQTYAAAASRLLAAGGQRWRRDEGKLVADLWVWSPPHAVARRTHVREVGLGTRRRPPLPGHVCVM